jgi:hypothetical protein
LSERNGYKMAETLAELRRVIFIRLPNGARGSPKSSSLRTIKDSKDVASLAAESVAATSLEVRGAVRARTSRPTSLPTSWSHLDARPTDYGPVVLALARTKPRRALPIAHNQIVCVTALASAVVIVRKAVTDQCTITHHAKRRISVADWMRIDPDMPGGPDLRLKMRCAIRTVGIIYRRWWPSRNQ